MLWGPFELPKPKDPSIFNGYQIHDSKENTIMTLSFWTNRSGQTVQTQIRLLLEDQGLHCLLFHLHLFDEIP